VRVIDVMAQDHLDLLATLTSTVPSILANTMLGPQDNDSIFASQQASFPGYNSNNNNNKTPTFTMIPPATTSPPYGLGYMPLYKFSLGLPFELPVEARGLQTTFVANAASRHLPETHPLLHAL
jgi:hypothetical protein